MLERVKLNGFHYCRTSQYVCAGVGMCVYMRTFIDCARGDLLRSSSQFYKYS